MWSSLICRLCVLHWGQRAACPSSFTATSPTRLCVQSAFWLSNSQVTVIPSLIIAPSKVSRKSHLLESRLSADFCKGEAWEELAPLCNQKTSALCKALQTMSVSPQRRAAAGTLSRQWRNINCVAPLSCLLKIHPHQVAGSPQPQQHSFS